MTRLGILPLSALALLATACQPQSTAAPGERGSVPETDAELAPGSEGDLRARGAFRSSASKEAVSELDDRWLTVTIQTRAADRSWWALGAGGTLRSGELLVTELDLYRPAHVYVIIVSASGKSTLLYPDPAFEQDSRLGRGTHRLPPERSEMPYIELDTEVGTEHIFVIAAAEPISDLDRDLGEIVAKLRRGESPMVTQGGKADSGSGSNGNEARKPRKSVKASVRARTRAEIDQALFRANAGAVPGLRERGGFRSRAEGAAIDAGAGDDGVVVVPFEFEHI